MSPRLRQWRRLRGAEHDKSRYEHATPVTGEALCALEGAWKRNPGNRRSAGGARAQESAGQRCWFFPVSWWAAGHAGRPSVGTKGTSNRRCGAGSKVSLCLFERGREIPVGHFPDTGISGKPRGAASNGDPGQRVALVFSIAGPAFKASRNPELRRHLRGTCGRGRVHTVMILVAGGKSTREKTR